MNKIILFCGCLLFAFAANSADLSLPDGRVFKQTELKKCADGFALIQHEKGEERIALNDLPENFIAALNSRQRNALRKNAILLMSDGKVYKKCIVKAMGSNALTIKHEEGIAVLQFKDLPRNYQATFTAKELLLISGEKTTLEISGKVIGKTANGMIVYSGPRGGKYFINERGRRVYLNKDVEIKPVEGVKVNGGQR